MKQNYFTTLPTARSPEWFRVNEAVAFSRISRPKIYQIIKTGKLKTVSLREPGQMKGTRLISADSLRAFLEARASGGEKTRE